ncbi:MAG: 50S ribosomal protein L29 [Bacteroidia bacterium]|nr:50S ribosomal protein L29 [Bacteroidia bacterium]
MKQNEIAKLTDTELTELLASERSSLEKQVLNHAVSPAENPLKIRSTRRTIARILTEMGSRKRRSA